jgi:hypothetical protein
MKPTDYAWIIDADHLNDGDPSLFGSDKGTFGPRNAPPELIERLRNGEGDTFIMLDDDGELYYTGRVLYADEAWANHEEPLQDFGMPNAGCTEIRYV